MGILTKIDFNKRVVGEPVEVESFGGKVNIKKWTARQSIEIDTLRLKMFAEIQDTNGIEDIQEDTEDDNEEIDNNKLPKIDTEKINETREKSLRIIAAQAEIIANSVCDENGNLLFDPNNKEHIDSIVDNISTDELTKLYNECTNRNSVNSLKEEAKNSETTQI